MTADCYQKKIRDVKTELEKYFKTKELKIEKDLEKVDNIVRIKVDRLLFDAMNHEAKLLIDHNDDTQLLAILKPLVSKQMVKLFDKLIKLNSLESNAKSEATVTDSTTLLTK